MGLNKAHPQHLINKILFNLFFLEKDDKGNTAAHKHWAPLSGTTRLPLMKWKDVITGLLLTIGENSSPSGSWPSSPSPEELRPSMKKMKLSRFKRRQQATIFSCVCLIH